MIPNFDDRENFARVLHANLSPTSPIESEEHLYARHKQVQQIQQALYAPGRSIFIYGDRGVGKTSLAHTIAYSYQCADRDPALIACGPDSTFSGVITSLISALKERKNAGSTVHTAKVGIKGIDFEFSRDRRENSEGMPAQFNLTTAVSALSEIDRPTGKETVVVVDEFDRIKSETERSHFADFIKQVGDQRIPIRFVYCGVAASMQGLLGAHESCFRYLEGVELQRLPWEGRFEIIDTTARAFGVEIETRARFRIASISDGFPYYVHLICEKLLWQMFNDEPACSTSNLDHYRAAVAEAVMGIEQHLRTTYEHAIMKETPGYEEVLWAVADHADLFRSTESIYDSYLRLPVGAEHLERQAVGARLAALKGASCGRILMNAKRGWYQFSESMMRGYARLRAEEKGIELATDYAAASKGTSGLTWAVRGARRARMTSREDWNKTEKPAD